jgi:transcriptional regulator with XRE-family HTH domain
MGRMKRPVPAKLSPKLLLIRRALNLSQTEMLRRLRLDDSYNRSAISGYERGEREPPLAVLLRYAEVANVCLDVLADDRQKLPNALPAKKKNQRCC